MYNKKDYEPSKGLKIVTQNKKIISVGIILLFVFFIIFMFFKFNKDLENTYYVAEIASSVIVVSGLVVSVLQYTASNVENSILRDKEKKIKAAEMANQFQAEMIPLLNTLAGAYSNSGFGKIVLEKMKKTEFVMFDKEEVDKIMSEIKIDISQLLISLYIGYLIDSGMVSKEEIFDEEGKLNISEENRKIAENKMTNCINDLSNKLEYFCICFNSGIADDDTVYQSLHNVFFQSVQMLYLFIFKDNTFEYDRLFSNITNLYIRWRERYKELVEKENEELINRKRDVQKKIVVKAKV